MSEFPISSVPSPLGHRSSGEGVMQATRAGARHGGGDRGGGGTRLLPLLLPRFLAPMGGRRPRLQHRAGHGLQRRAGFPARPTPGRCADVLLAELDASASAQDALLWLRDGGRRRARHALSDAGRRVAVEADRVSASPRGRGRHRRRRRCRCLPAVRPLPRGTAPPVPHRHRDRPRRRGPARKRPAAGGRGRRRRPAPRGQRLRRLWSPTSRPSS